MNIGIVILLLGITLLVLSIVFLIIYFRVLTAKKKKNQSDFFLALKKVAVVIGLKFVLIDILVMLVGGVLFFLGLHLLILQMQWNTVANIVVSQGENACTCAVECTNNSNNDGLTSYEILYGANEYNHMLARVFRASQIRELNSLQTGEEKSDYILANANWDALEDYEIKALQDKKVNGRNIECPVCRDLGSEQLATECKGEPPYSESWSWSKSTLTTDDWFGKNEDGSSGPFQDAQGSGSGSATVGTTQGNATGAYAIQLDDGSYYWYHQGGPSCNNSCGGYCGDWSHTFWRESRKWFRNNGCAIYSLAIAISNLLGQEITPTQILYDLGCTPHDENGIRVWETSSANFAAPGVDIKRPNAIETLARKYGFQYKALTDDIASWDEILDKGGYIWNSWWDAKCEWCQSTDPRNSHFMVIRKKQGDNYYCFTSCRGRAGGGLSGLPGAIATMNVPINKQTVINSVKNPGSGWGIWLDEPVGGSDGSVSMVSTDKWYSDVTGTKATAGIDFGDGIKLYNALPWAAPAGSGVYFLDTDEATKSVYEFLESTGATAKRSLEYTLTTNGRFSRFCFLSTAKSDPGVLQYGNWNVSGSVAATKRLDGVTCVGIAPMPIVIDKNYNTSFSAGEDWAHKTTPSASEYRDKKLALVLESKSDGKTYYLPCSPAEAKGHTFPGGIVQTSVQITGYRNGVFSINYARSSGDPSGSPMKLNESTLGAEYANLKIEGKNSPYDYMYNVCEVCGWSSTFIEKMTSNYRVIGYVIWP